MGFSSEADETIANKGMSVFVFELHGIVLWYQYNPSVFVFDSSSSSWLSSTIIIIIILTVSKATSRFPHCACLLYESTLSKARPTHHLRAPHSLCHTCHRHHPQDQHRIPDRYRFNIDQYEVSPLAIRRVQNWLLMFNGLVQVESFFISLFVLKTLNTFASQLGSLYKDDDEKRVLCISVIYSRLVLHADVGTK